MERPKHWIALITALTLVTALTMTGCGYGFQNSRNPLKDKGIERVYVSPLLNNTYKPGVENLVYNAVVRSIVSHRKVVLVQTPELADAILQGSVTLARSVGAGAIAIGSLAKKPQEPFPTDPLYQKFKEYNVSSQYNAELAVAFSLVEKDVVLGRNPTLWAASFVRSRPFPTATALGVQGTTSALINESELDRVLAELAKIVAADVHESMLGIF